VSWLRFAAANLLLSPLTSAVNVMLMTLGTASIVLLLLAGDRLTDTLARDARGVDLVIGAKGSPAQLILSAVYHADIPPGNIRYADAEAWAEDSRVALAAPLSLGDSFRGFRIVGTTPAYLELTGAAVAEGALWQEPLEALIGAAVARASGLRVGDRFRGVHGFSDNGHAHDSRAYRVVGILAPLGSVVDRLVLTGLESVWELHGEREEHEDGAAHQEEGHDDAGVDADHHAGTAGHDPDLEITALLLRYRTPLAAMTLPRDVNGAAGLQAAAPAMEIARILQLVGLGLEGLRAFAWVLIITACLSVFAALYGSLRSRRGDLAMLRCLGATRFEIFFAMMVEGMLLSLMGIALGYSLGHGVMSLISWWLETSRGVSLAGLYWVSAETRLLLVLLAVSLLSAAIPSIQAYRTDVARTLAEGGS
jgi:putative ABC transport system permease protein